MGCLQQMDFMKLLNENNDPPGTEADRGSNLAKRPRKLHQPTGRVWPHEPLYVGDPAHRPRKVTRSDPGIFKGQPSCLFYRLFSRAFDLIGLPEDPCH